MVPQTGHIPIGTWDQVYEKLHTWQQVGFQRNRPTDVDQAPGQATSRSHIQGARQLRMRSTRRTTRHRATGHVDGCCGRARTLRTIGSKCSSGSVG